MKDLTLVRSNERVDDLERNGYLLIQNPEVFCFGIDAILLAHFAKISSDKQKVLDIGTGTGIIPIVMHANYQKGNYTGIDIQEEMVEMANRSVKLNGIEGSVRMLHVDIRNYKDYFKSCEFDIITTNPPYMKGDIGLKNEHPSKNLARHEIACTLEDIINASSDMLKYSGKLCMIHRPLRLVEILMTMKKYNLEPKRLRFIHPKKNREPNMVLIEAVKNAKPEMRVQPPLIVYNEDGSYTDEIYEIYGKEKKE
ncbi:SAM-dependent methyltransferase [Sporanaerobium hydrogeniformans]|uniref:SAM-dependent methyltransferase n=1 Tax=Sporanaerobium hydrogeniformans TaxID=3072179 RepID=A0AC61D9P2_9FIRM|nr:SAM-dependent methyltransferase [Sporanaerobium hydrogeniformans]